MFFKFCCEKTFACANFKDVPRKTYSQLLNPKHVQKCTQLMTKGVVTSI